MKKLLFALLAAGTLFFSACSASTESPSSSQEGTNPSVEIDMENLQVIYYAGGCFWGVEEYFSRIPGVYDVTSGYANGTTEDPTYDEVCYGDTGHAETVHVQYDPNIVSLETLTKQFFKIINPTSKNRQGNDVGGQYRSGVYYVNEADKPIIEAVFAAEQKKYEEDIVTELVPLKHYYLAEEYHQDYLKKNPNGYCHVDFSTLDELETQKPKVDPSLYSKPSEEEIRAMLSPEEYNTTQNAGTEPSFSGKFYDHFERGIYVDIVTGEPLFSSADKFESGCGWPSFSKPIDPAVIVETPDTTLGLARTEYAAG